MGNIGNHCTVTLLPLSREQEKNKRLESEKMLDVDRKNFDKLKLDFEARIDTFRNRNTDIEDELRREIATLQKLIETLREQVRVSGEVGE